MTGTWILRGVAALACLAVMVSVVHAQGPLLAQQPYPDSAEYADSARQLAHGNGYVTYVHQGERQPPRYPPGFPAALSPFAAVGSFPTNVERGATAFALLYVLVAVIAAWALGGPLAATIAAVLIGVSPFARDSAGLVLSDALGAALVVAVLPLVALATRARARMAGALTGIATTIRLTAGVALIALLAASPRPNRRAVLAFALPSIVALGLLQWAMFGSPLKTGYSYWGVADNSFKLSYATSPNTSREGPFINPDMLHGDLMSWTCPCGAGGSQARLSNVAFYPVLLAGGYWVFAPPLVGLLGLCYAWRRRRDPVGRYALLLVALSLVVFIFYAFQGTRFMAGPATVLTVLAAVWAADLLSGFVQRAAARRPLPASDPAARTG